ncbi:hypothetical protein CTI12_AA532620 [Artemisia annua]|uniref:Uncharacterized protein n=1 Tax=Artemisia annua TaxID=35608 RepID=A0A2U1L423_ARTAN|nr:hypothetical protein CTI12_AA532620 [Artemisia annua]
MEKVDRDPSMAAKANSQGSNANQDAITPDIGLSQQPMQAVIGSVTQDANARLFRVTDDISDVFPEAVCRDASLGLCQCEKDDWRSLEDEQWSFVMSPYEQLFVDVKLSPGTSGFEAVCRDASLDLQCEKDDLTIFEDEQMEACNHLLATICDVKLSPGPAVIVSVYLMKYVSFEMKEVIACPDGCYGALAIGLSLLFWAPVASKCLPSDYSSDTVRILAVRAIALTFIFQSSKDTLFAMVAVVTCLTVYILTRFIK